MWISLTTLTIDDTIFRAAFGFNHNIFTQKVYIMIPHSGVNAIGYQNSIAVSGIIDSGLNIRIFGGYIRYIIKMCKKRTGDPFAPHGTVTNPDTHIIIGIVEKC